MTDHSIITVTVFEACIHVLNRMETFKLCQKCIFRMIVVKYIIVLSLRVENEIYVLFSDAKT